MSRFFLFISLLLWQNSGTANEPLQFYYRISDTTEYHNYPNDLIKLALEKTTAEFGPYTMIPVEPEANTLRALSDIIQNRYGNMVLEQSYDPELDNSQLTFIPIPIDSGINGYRICFVSPAKQKEIAKVDQLNQLKKFTIAQGVGWTDSKILKANDLNVLELSNYANIFKMVVSNRVDLFCRGANQIEPEMQHFKHLHTLDFDKTFVLMYDAPRFFYIHQKNQAAKARIEKGLNIAFKDGSLKLLWEQHHRKTIDYVDLSKRKIIRLENPLVNNLPPDYRDYYFNFLSP